MSAILMFLAVLSPVHHGHTWWVGENNTATFNAVAGDTINVLMDGEHDADDCDWMGGTLVAKHNIVVCKNPDF